MPFISGNPFSQQGGNPFMQSPYMFNPMMNPGGMAGGSSDFFSGLFNSLGQQGGADPSVAPFWFDFFTKTMWPAQQEALKNQGQNPMLDFFQNDWWPWWKEQQGQEPAALKWPYAGPVGGLAGGDLGYYFNPNDNQFYFQDGTLSGMIWNPQDKRIYYGKDYKNPSLYGYDPTIDQISMFDTGAGGDGGGGGGGGGGGEGGLSYLGGLAWWDPISGEIFYGQDAATATDTGGLAQPGTQPKVNIDLYGNSHIAVIGGDQWVWSYSPTARTWFKLGEAKSINQLTPNNNGTNSITVTGNDDNVYQKTYNAQTGQTISDWAATGETQPPTPTPTGGGLTYLGGSAWWDPTSGEIFYGSSASGATDTGGFAQPGTQPKVNIDANGQSHIAVIGGDQGVWTYSPTTNQWTNLGSAKSVDQFSMNPDGTASITVTGNDDLAYTKTFNSYSGATISDWAATGETQPPTPTPTGGGLSYLGGLAWWDPISGEIFYGSSASGATDTGGFAQPGTQPKVAIDANGQSYVSVIGGDQGIWTYSPIDGQWKNLGSAKSVDQFSIDSDSSASITVTGNDDLVYEKTFNPQTGEDITPWSATSDTGGGDTGGDGGTGDTGAWDWRGPPPTAPVYVLDPVGQSNSEWFSTADLIYDPNSHMLYYKDDPNTPLFSVGADQQLTDLGTQNGPTGMYIDTITGQMWAIAPNSVGATYQTFQKGGPSYMNVIYPGFAQGYSAIYFDPATNKMLFPTYDSHGNFAYMSDFGNYNPANHVATLESTTGSYQMLFDPTTGWAYAMAPVYV